MSITTPAFRFALTAAAVVLAAPPADARPRRLVVLDFDGPRQLADAGRSSVLSVLGNQYDVVATKRWEQARASAAQQSHGPAQWSRAAKQAGVDAVIEGWVQDEGRHKILNIVVRQADNGREFDTISIRIDGKTGVSSDSVHQLQNSLDEVLDWIDSGQVDPPPGLPVVNLRRPAPAKLVTTAAVTGRGRTARAEDAAAARRPARRPAVELAADVEPRDAAPDDAAAPPAARPVDRAAAATDPPGEPPPAAALAAEPARAARPAEVSTADREAHEIEILFPQNSEERKEVLGNKADHVPQKTPRFMIDAGPYMGSRSLQWDVNVIDPSVPQPAGVTSKGLAVNAAIYPFPVQPIDGVLSGFGFTASIHHSLGSTVQADYDDAVEEYVINQNGWEVGAHYRAPLSSLVSFDGGVFYGDQTYELVDAPRDFKFPDTKYSYVGASAHVDLAVTDRARVGFGLRYFSVLDAGDLSADDMFGPVSASGLGLEGSFVMPLPSQLYVRGELSYQRISLETSGTGEVTEQNSITGGTDSLVKGSVNLGIAF